ARGLAEVVALRARQRGAGRIVVLAGHGDNGGDALHAAALLAREPGGPADAAAGVSVVGVARRLHEGGSRAAHEAGVPVHGVDPDGDELPGDVAAVLAEADLVVDGLLGIGGRP